MKRTTSCRHRSTCGGSAPTCATPSVARCQRSWSSHSAIDTLNWFCTRALIVRSTLRFPLSEWFSGSQSSSRSTPTTMAGPPGASGSGRRRGLALARGRREAPGHLLDLVRLDDVAHLDVLEALEREAALVAAGHLARVFLEPLEAPDPPVVHDDVVAQQAGLGAAHDLPVAHRAASNLADARDHEDLTHLGPAEHLLVQRRLEQALERVSHVVHRPVDHRVEPDVD